MHQSVYNESISHRSFTFWQSNLLGCRWIYRGVCFQGAAAYPENEDQQQRLREAAEGLRVATNAAAQNAIKKKLINRLEVRKAKSNLKNRHISVLPKIF